MDITAFSNLLRRHDMAVFAMREAQVLVPCVRKTVLRLQLHQWCRKGWVRRLRRGLYELAYPEATALPDLWVANRLYEPSYVSLETALSQHQIIPETAAQVTSVTTRPTRRFKTPHGLFTYATVRPAAFAGYALRRIQGRVVRIAEPEKALMDRLYFGLRRGESLRELKEERWDARLLRAMSRGRLSSYAALFGFYRPRLEERIHALLR